MGFAEPLDQGADFVDLPRVEPDGGFVQDQDLGVADDGLGQPYPLLVSLGQPADDAAADVAQVTFFDGIPHPSLPGVGAHPLDPGHEIQVGVHRHFRVERRVFREIADAAADFEALLEHVMPGDPGGPFRGRHVAGENAHGGGFSRPVGAEEAQNLPFFHSEGDVVHHFAPAIGFAYMFDFDHAHSSGVTAPPDAGRPGQTSAQRESSKPQIIMKSLCRVNRPEPGSRLIICGIRGKSPPSPELSCEIRGAVL